jgi:plastocyanin
MRYSTHLRRLVFTLLIGTGLAFAQTTIKAHVEVNKGGHPLKDASNAVIWLIPIGATGDPPRQNPSEIPRLVQKNKQFHPPLIVVPVGGKVEFPNQDPFFHNVFSLFEGERFDLGLYESGTTRIVQFDKPGISYIFCNIHAEMSAVIIAVNTPYYGISDARGEISLPRVTPGRYELQVFHSSVAPDQLRTLRREITITEGDTFIGSFTLSESDLYSAHKNKYDREYDRPNPPDSPAYARP